MSTTAWEPRRHRLTVEDYYRMGEVGILAPDTRVELIDGEIIDMPPPGNLHAGTVDQLVLVLGQAVASRALLRVQNPLWLDEHSEPRPDVSVLKPRTDFYKSCRPQPADALLVVEVSDSSLRFDRDVKVALYARHGIAEVWLVDLRAKRLVRHREPLRGVYTRIDEPNLSTPVEINALSGVRVDLGTLFSS
jgi:Uma2 family endonuclease